MSVTRKSTSKKNVRAPKKASTESKKSVCLYFHVHQPLRVKPFSVFQIGNDHEYFGGSKDVRLDNAAIMKKVAEKCYIPACELLLKLLKKHPDFACSFSISGLALEQFEKYTPEVVDLLKKLVKTGRVELLGETYYHSLASLYSREEFESQVHMHTEKLKKLFNVKPVSFRNTELIYSNQVAKIAEDLGYSTILSEGVDTVLGDRSPNVVYRPAGTEHIRLLLKNYRLSDDIAFRFSNQSWNEWPLTVEKFVSWVMKQPGDLVNLFMDFETLGEHQWKETGIFDFFEALPEALLSARGSFKTVSEAALTTEPVGEMDIPHHISWADVDRDLSAWQHNDMQTSALKEAFALSEPVISSKDAILIHDWRCLLTSDHFYYMSTKLYEDGEVHSYFSPYETPYDAFTNYMNVLHDIRYRVKQIV